MAPRLNFLPDALSKTLLDFQQEGVLFGISKNGKCLIGDEMGLGKTLQALSIAYYYKSEWPLLIVCPSSMRFPWIEEIEKWLPDIQPNEINLVLSGTDASNLKSSKISIIGYGLLSHASSHLLINCLKETKFGVVVVDESHYMKNRKAARTKALISVIKSAKRAVLLTGTPALARPEELYVQIDVLKPNLLGTFGKFTERFCEAHMEYVCGGRVKRWNTQGASNLDELHNILKTNVMIRRLKRHVLTQLPPKRRQRITFDLADSEFKKQLTDVIKEFRKVSHQIRGKVAVPTDKNPVFEMMRLTTLLYKQTGLSKISAVRQYIADMLDNSDKKFLVFAHHLDVMKAIELEVVKKKVKYIRIAGDVPSAHRGSLVHEFQSDSTVRVAILSILAASVGITLTSADHVIFAELHWTPGVMQQAEDRVHRIGQQNSVLVQYLVAKGTIDEVLWRMVCNKMYVTSAALNGKLQGLDVEEASEGQSKLLEAFSAWVTEDEEEEISEDEFLFTHSQKKRKQDSLQRSLTEFFHSPSSSKCRKTDHGKEWSALPQSSSEEDEKCETLVEKELSTPKVEVCVIDEMDEDSALRKTTRKTYKVAKKKSPEDEPKTRSKTVVAKVIIDGDEKAPDGGLFGPVGLTPECKPAHKTNKINIEEKDEKRTETDVDDILSGYTRLLNKPKLVNDNKGSDSTKVSSELLRFEDENSGSVKMSSEKNKNEAVDIDFKKDNVCSRISELDKSVAHEDCNPVEDCSSNEQPATTSEISASSNDEDLGDFKSGNPWCCSLCTFNNNGFLAVCEMCETPRQRTRRKMTKTTLATPEFVKRKQQRIFERCFVPEKKIKSRKNTSKKEEDVVVCVRELEKDIGSKGTASDCTTLIHQADVDERKTELHERPGNQSSKIVLLETGAESRVSSTSVDEDEAAPKIKHESEAEESDAVTCNTKLSVAACVGEEASDEVMTSCDESIEEAKAATEELFFPGDEFDDFTDEDWWLCEVCQKYNYDDTADHCELCGEAKTNPSDSVEDMVPNFGADWWRCEDCGEFYFNADVDTKCDKCEKPDSSQVKKSFVEDWVEYRHLIIDDNHAGHVGMLRTVENLMFCSSRYTDRVYLYDENGEPLNCNVSLLDLESSNTENLPHLLTDTSNRKQALRFMRKWKSLQERQRRLLRRSGIIFEDPYEAAEAVKMGREQKLCTNRFPSKEKLQAEVLTTALENNGTVRHCTKTKQQHRGASGPKNAAISNSSAGGSTGATTSTNQRTWTQAIDETGRPLCISCQAPVETKNTECLWDERFCSHKCKEDYQIRICGSRVRQRLFEEEKGVCQRCRCDAHNLYQIIKFLPKPERRAYLENTSFLTLPVTLLNKIIIDPKEGMFWEADHVIPVVEGGGECGLENYRTLCVPCHRQATAELRQRLKTNRLKARPAGIPDITSFFNT